MSTRLVGPETLRCGCVFVAYGVEPVWCAEHREYYRKLREAGIRPAKWWLEPPRERPPLIKQRPWWRRLLRYLWWGYAPPPIPRVPRLSERAPDDCDYCHPELCEGDEPRWLQSECGDWWEPEHPERACRRCQGGFRYTRGGKVWRLA